LLVEKALYAVGEQLLLFRKLEIHVLRLRV